MKTFFSILSLIVACFGVFFVFNAKKAFQKEADSIAVGYLKSQVPEKFGGVTSVEKPLGATEEVERASEKILNVSDYLNREYTLSSGKKVSVYISYWAPAKEPIVTASTHTPDRCWVKNGWSCNDKTRRFKDIIVLDDANKKLKPARYGEYSYVSSMSMGKKFTRYVWYWFLVEGEVYEFTKSNYYTSPLAWVKNTLSQLKNKAPEMYFVRIDADFSLDELREDKEFQQLLAYLGDMILFEGAKGRVGNAR